MIIEEDTPISLMILSLLLLILLLMCAGRLVYYFQSKWRVKFLIYSLLNIFVGLA